VTAVKLLTMTYLFGAAVFAFGLLVILLAVASVETVGKRIDVAVSIIGGFVLMIGSKFTARAALRKAERS
jgi:hypothetical protein